MSSISSRIFSTYDYFTGKFTSAFISVHDVDVAIQNEREF